MALKIKLWPTYSICRDFATSLTRSRISTFNWPSTQLWPDRHHVQKFITDYRSVNLCFWQITFIKFIRKFHINDVKPFEIYIHDKDLYQPQPSISYDMTVARRIVLREWESGTMPVQGPTWRDGRGEDTFINNIHQQQIWSNVCCWCWWKPSQ